MRLIDKVRHRVRTFLEIENNQNNSIYIQNLTDFETQCHLNRVWSWGDKEALQQIYQQIEQGTTKLNFWTATSISGLLKRHTGLPGQIVRILTDIIMRDLNNIKISSERKFEWEEINKNIQLETIIEEAVKETLIVGDGAFQISIDTKNAKSPIAVEFISGENLEYKFIKGKVQEIVFKSTISHNHKKYIVEEEYGYGYINTKLYDNDKEVPLNTIPSLAGINSTVQFDNSFIMAVPLMFFKSNRFKGRGESIYKGKTDSFDAMDETWSQWLDALRKGRSKQYIPKNLLPVNPVTGEYMKSNDFDNVFIALEDNMSEGSKSEIKLIQPNIPYESYLSTYITALDLCLQGIISPSTLGIDTKKMDNAEAQREKEKTTLYTRNKMIEALQKTLPAVINNIFKTFDTLNKKELKDIDVEISFGEYANPSFESQVETVSKARNGQIMSIEASVDELYGETKDDEWKKEEVQRIKEEQGIATESEPDIRDDMTLLQNSSLIDNNQTLESKASTLNGAQIGSLLSIIQSYSTGAISRSAAISIVTSTLGISKENAETFIEEQIKETPPSK